MSGFKNTEMSRIPKSWDLIPFGYLLKEPLRNGLNKPSRVRGSGTKMVNMNEIFANERIHSINMERVPLTTKEKTSSLLRRGDLLFARQSLVLEGAGKCAIFLSDEDVCFESHIIRARMNIKKANPQFYHAFFCSNLGKQYMRTIVEQAVVAGIRGSDLKDLLVPYPSLDEQNGIANIITAITDKIELLIKQNKTLEKIAQTLFKRWFVEFEFSDKDGKPYKSSGGKMVESELGEIPEEWNVSKIGEKIEVVGGGTPSTSVEDYWVNGDINWYSPTDLTKSKTLFSIGSEKKISRLGLKESSARLFPAYCVLMTSRATIGEIAINTKKACTNQGFITLIPNKDFPYFFLHNWLKRQVREIKILASGSTFDEISKSSFRDLTVVAPTQGIMKRFSQVVKPIYEKVENNIFQIKTLTRLRDTLLPKLMSGKVRVKY